MSLKPNKQERVVVYPTPTTKPDALKRGDSPAGDLRRSSPSYETGSVQDALSFNPDDYKFDFSDQLVPSTIKKEPNVGLPLPSMKQTSNMSTAVDTTGQVCPPGKEPRVTTILWEDEGALCFGVEVRGIEVVRREDNNMVNATKLLNVAGMTRARRDGILKSEKMRHVVKIGPMHFKGVWIPLERALDLANKENITEILYPLFIHNIGALLYHPTNQTETNQGTTAAAQFEPEINENVHSSLPRVPIEWSSHRAVHHHHHHHIPTPPDSASSSTKSDGNRQWKVRTIPGPRTRHSGANSNLSKRKERPATPTTPPPGSQSSLSHYRPDLEGLQSDTRSLESVNHQESEMPSKNPMEYVEYDASQRVLSKHGILGPMSLLQSPLVTDHNKMSLSNLVKQDSGDEKVDGAEGGDLILEGATRAEPSIAARINDEGGYSALDKKSLNYLEHRLLEVRGKGKDIYVPNSDESPSQDSPQSNSESSSDSEPGLLTRYEQKNFLLERLMSYFYELFSSCRSPVLITTAANSDRESRTEVNGSSGSLDNTIGSTSGSSNAPDHSMGAERKRVSKERDDEDRDEDRPGKRTRVIGDKNTCSRKLACPYFKKDPEHFQLARSCSGPGWDTVHRIKEHLDRKHALPPSCVRCYTAFKTDADRDAHMRSQDQCEVKERPARTHGFDPSQRDQLKSRPKGYKQMSEAQKWCHVYMILFPETAIEDIPSPYYEFRSLRDSGHPADPMVEYESFLRREMPDRVRHQLELRIEDVLNPIEETLRGQIVDIVRDVQLELFQSFRASIGTAPPNSHSNQEAAITEANSTTEQIRVSEGGIISNPGPASRPTDADLLNQLLPGDSSWEEQMQAYQPVPPLDLSSLDFDGELFDFSSLVNIPAVEDSTYGTLSTSQADTNKDPFLWNERSSN
ncbi:hypothetical protein F4805DRAFT_419639 [Annulohypoxylon moriforme]|nr:hypothetical protein F4805DRAFT_419639 [Annulohypoxylon moriforme]